MKENQIWKMKDGKKVRWIDETGRVKQRTFPSAFEAEQYIANITGGKPSNVSIGSLFREFVHTRGLAENTMIFYEYLWSKVEKDLGDLSLSSFTSSENLQGSNKNLIMAIEKTSPTKTTQRGILTMLRTLFKYGQDMGLCKANPAMMLRRPKCPQTIKRIVKPEEYVAVSQAVSVRMNVAMTLGRFMGLRQGEAVSLRWCDVDLESKKICVRCYEPFEIDGILQEGFNTKNRQYRYVPIPDIALPILRNWRTQNGFAPRVLDTWIDGTWRKYQAISAWLHQAIKNVGVPRFRFHDLRRTYLTQLARNGVDMHQLAELAGHLNSAVTGQYYIAANMDNIGKTVNDAI